MQFVETKEKTKIDNKESLVLPCASSKILSRPTFSFKLSDDTVKSILLENRENSKLLDEFRKICITRGWNVEDYELFDNADQLIDIQTRSLSSVPNYIVSVKLKLKIKKEKSDDGKTEKNNQDQESKHKPKKTRSTDPSNPQLKTSNPSDVVDILEDDYFGVITICKVTH